MKIVNKKKFVRSMMILIIVILGIFALVNNTLSHSDINYKKIYISYGDTLWNIAREQKADNEYFENRDIRSIVDEIKYTNHLTNSELEIGQELTIPTI